jgi:hypothetical protein
MLHDGARLEVAVKLVTPAENDASCFERIHNEASWIRSQLHLAIHRLAAAPGCTLVRCVWHLYLKIHRPQLVHEPLHRHDSNNKSPC